ncbi:MAG: hypothetical protein M9887_05665 [Chitinophagales bacterium]|nr:hypothetical protein [Chitinophagales bacterium]
MAKALFIEVKESEAELKKLVRNARPMFVPRINMLIEMKKEGEKGISKRELMKRLGLSGQSVTDWRKMYRDGGIEKLLSHAMKGFKPSVFTKEDHQKISDLLHNPENGLAGFSELKEWIFENLGKDIKYNTILKYCIRHFGAKAKVARKSHINKDDQAVEAFKKTLVVSVQKS